MELALCSAVLESCLTEIRMLTALIYGEVGACACVQVCVLIEEG